MPKAEPLENERPAAAAPRVVLDLVARFEQQPAAYVLGLLAKSALRAVINVDTVFPAQELGF
jgi:hypothetical protein